MGIQKKDITCPHCHKKNVWTEDNMFRPFCSERCQLIDLGGWASEQHRIVGDPISSANSDEFDESGSPE